MPDFSKVLRPDFEQVVLEKVRLSLERVFQREQLHFLRNELQVEAYLCQRTQDLVLRITTAVIAKERVEEEVCTRKVACPANWWQHFRERWFPKWWLARWPVRYKFTDIEIHKHYYCCPHVAWVLGK